MLLSVSGMPPPAFHPFSFSHLIILTLTAMWAGGMILLRRRGVSQVVVMERLLITALLLEWPASMVAHYQLGDFSRQNALPFHLCDVAAFAGALALLKRRQLAAELCYFFGLTGTLQGLITPALREDFPHMRFFAFFLGHSSVVIAALYVVFGLRLIPRANAPQRLLGWLLVYTAVAGAINAVLRTNYGFLCRKPPSPSLMDVLGPWPWYVASLGAFGWVIFTLLNLPFLKAQRHAQDLSLPSQGP